MYDVRIEPNKYLDQNLHLQHFFLQADGQSNISNPIYEHFSL